MGGVLRFCPEARVAHVHPARLMPYLRTQLRHGFWRMKLYAKHPTGVSGDQYADRNGYDVAIQCDADGQHPVDRIRTLVERLEQGDLDLVIGSRYVADTGYRPSLSRRVGKSILSRLVDRVTGGGITDTTSGFRAGNRKVIRTFARHYPDDYPEAESLVLLHMYGLRAGEVSVAMRDRQGGVTSISARDGAYYMVKVGLAILIDLFHNYAKRHEDARNV